MTELPANIKRLFWDMDSDALDAEKHADAIIERVLNTGSLADWKWLVQNYGTGAIQSRLSRKTMFGRDNFRPESRRLASLILR
ncbi:MAG: hypothetical protein WAN50_03695 [Minisyncoccia bacterium]